MWRPSCCCKKRCEAIVKRAFGKGIDTVRERLTGGGECAIFRETGMKPVSGIEIPKLFIAGKSIYIGML